MSENKIVLFGKEYQLKISRGVKDIASNTLVGLFTIAPNEDNVSASFEVSARPQGEKILEFEPKFVKAVEDGFKAEMDLAKAKEQAAKSSGASSGQTKVIDAEVVEEAK